MRRVHRIVFAIVLFIWTWLLLKPNPVPEFVNESLMGDVKFYLGKLLHVSMYAALMIYGTWFISRSYWKWLALGLVSHGILTEIGQYYGDLWFQTHRTGRVYDVMIDSTGMLIGWAVASRMQQFLQSGEITPWLRKRSVTDVGPAAEVRIE